MQNMIGHKQQRDTKLNGANLNLQAITSLLPVLYLFQWEACQDTDHLLWVCIVPYPMVFYWGIFIGLCCALGSHSPIMTVGICTSALQWLTVSLSGNAQYRWVIVVWVCSWCVG